MKVNATTLYNQWYQNLKKMCLKFKINFTHNYLFIYKRPKS